MKHIILITLSVLVLASCGNKSIVYQGYVYHDGKPLDQVMVREMNGNREIFTETDSTGFFELDKDPNSIRSLIFEKNGFVTDTVQTVWTQHGEKLMYRFIEEKDTLFIERH